MIEVRNTINATWVRCLVALIAELFGRALAEVEATVSDDGEGFEAAAAPPDERRSFGLFSIQERFDDLGGRVVVRSAPGEGTAVTLVLPYRPEAAEEGE